VRDLKDQGLTKHIGIVSRIDKKEALELASKIFHYLKQREVRISLEMAIADFIGEPTSGRKLEEMSVDLLVVIGGNGTILRTCAAYPVSETPILAINMGARGLLTEVSPSEAQKALDDYLAGKYTLEECMKLSTYVNDELVADALNDVLLTSSKPSKILHFEILRKGSLPITCLADGILFSTPTGSTAHSFSAGGPVLDPHTDTFALTPICPLTSFRSIVFSSVSIIEVRLIKPRLKASLIIDGMYKQDISAEDRILVKKSSRKAIFIRFLPDHFSRRLKKRLSLT
jgi:NAD+ kinase